MITMRPLHCNWQISGIQLELQLKLQTTYRQLPVPFGLFIRGFGLATLGRSELSPPYTFAGESIGAITMISPKLAHTTFKYIGTTMPYSTLFSLWHLAAVSPYGTNSDSKDARVRVTLANGSTNLAKPMSLLFLIDHTSTCHGPVE